MKNFFILALCAFFFSFIFSSCSTEDLPGVGVSKSWQAKYWYTFPQTADRYDCNGKALLYPKITGWQSVGDSLPVLCSFTNSELNDAGYFYKGKKTTALNNIEHLPVLPNYTWWNDGWFWWPFLFLLVLAIMAWQLYRLANCCNSRRNQNPVVPPASRPDNTMAQNALNLVGQKSGRMIYHNDGGFEITIFPPKSEQSEQGRFRGNTRSGNMREQGAQDNTKTSHES